MTKMLFIGGNQNGKEFDVAQQNRIEFVSPRGLDFPRDVYFVEQAADGTFYAVIEGMMR